MKLTSRVTAGEARAWRAAVGPSLPSRRRRHRLLGWALLASACGGALVACSYDPHPDDGKLQCSPDRGCPQGYRCELASNTCFSDAAAGAGAGGGSQLGSGGTFGGTGGAASTGTGGGAISSNRSDYIADWAFGPLSTVMATCDNGKSEMASLADRPADPNGRSIMNITSGPSGLADLASSWLCDLWLDVDGSGAHLGGGNHTCTMEAGSTTDITMPTKSTWTATAFEVSLPANDRTHATHTATYTRVDTYITGTIVTCAQMVRADLQKL